MEQPPKFVHPNLHGRFSTCLNLIGFIWAKANSSLFMYNHGTNIILLLVYIDDIIVINIAISSFSHLIH